MQNDRVFGPDDNGDWKSLVPPALMALGAISLLRNSRLLCMALAGAWLYEVANSSDRDRRVRKHSDAARVETADEDSFPASDPPSYTGTTAGAP